jgi:hypothetical protein
MGFNRRSGGATCWIHGRNGCAGRGGDPRLWRSVISELEDAERRTVDNDAEPSSA